MITFFGQALPKKFQWGQDRIRNVRSGASSKEGEPPLFEDGGCDLMIVIGTALAVMPFNMAVYAADIECPKVLINLENTNENGFDFEDPVDYPERLFLRGKCDDIIWKLVEDIGWTDQFNAILPKKH